MGLRSFGRYEVNRVSEREDALKGTKVRALMVRKGVSVEPRI